MTLPRWTTYPALAALAFFALAAIPRVKPVAEPHADAALAARHDPLASAAATTSRFKRVVVLGIDGLDPELLAETVRRFLDRM